MIVKDNNIVEIYLIKVIVYYDNYNYWDFDNNIDILVYNFVIVVFKYNIEFSVCYCNIGRLIGNNIAEPGIRNIIYFITFINYGVYV